MRSLISGLVLLAFLATPLALEAANVSEAKRLIDQDRIRAAAEALKAATEKDDEDAKAWALLADVSLQIKDLETADKAAYNALDLDEENPEYWKLAGRVAFERGVAAYAARQPGNQIKSWFAEAEAKFGRCLKMDEKDKEIRWWLAWAKEWQEYPKKARKYYDEQIEKFPAEPKGYVRLGAMIANEAIGTGNGVTPEAQKIRKGAIEVFEKGLEKSGPDAELLYNLGLAIEWAGKKDDAKAKYLEAIDADPDYYKAWKRLYDLKVPGSVLLPLAKKALGKHKNNGTAAY
ncbi:MAG: tetratricopeptide repeat protein, partial [Planctomycetota bacterium]